MMGAAAAHLVKARCWPLLALLLLLAGCATLIKDTVVIHERAETRLATRVKEGLFLTTVRIGEREAGPFIVDTGASHIVLDSALARELNLSFWGDRYEPAIRQKVRWGTLASLEVGPITLRNTDVVVMDLSFVSAQVEERLAGVLGHPFFAKAVVEVDYATGSVACFDPKTYRLPRGGWLPLTVKANRPIISARLEGDIEGQFLLDTGNTGTVFFYPDFVQEHALLENRETRKHQTTFMDGVYETRSARIAWFELAGRRFEQPIVEFAPASMPKSRIQGVAGIIGRGLLRRFTVVFNYSESRIALLPK